MLSAQAAGVEVVAATAEEEAGSLQLAEAANEEVDAGAARVPSVEAQTEAEVPRQSLLASAPRVVVVKIKTEEGKVERAARVRAVEEARTERMAQRGRMTRSAPPVGRQMPPSGNVAEAKRSVGVEAAAHRQLPQRREGVMQSARAQAEVLSADLAADHPLLPDPSRNPSRHRGRSPSRQRGDSVDRRNDRIRVKPRPTNKQFCESRRGVLAKKTKTCRQRAFIVVWSRAVYQFPNFPRVLRAACSLVQVPHKAQHHPSPRHPRHNKRPHLRPALFPNLHSLLLLRVWNCRISGGGQNHQTWLSWKAWGLFQPRAPTLRNRQQARREEQVPVALSQRAAQHPLTRRVWAEPHRRRPPLSTRHRPRKVAPRGAAPRLPPIRPKPRQRFFLSLSPQGLRVRLRQPRALQRPLRRPLLRKILLGI